MFVKNRRADTSRAAPGRDFVANLVAWRDAEAAPDTTEINPYLGRKLDIPLPLVPGTQDVEIELRSWPVLDDELILPVVDIHLRVDRVHVVGHQQHRDVFAAADIADQGADEPGGWESLLSPPRCAPRVKP